MSRRSLALLAIVVVGVGIRVTYTITTGYTLKGEPRVGEIAHNIVTHGRWFVRNSKAEAYVTALSIRRDRLIDPASVDYANLDGKNQWYPEIGESVGASVVLAGLWAISGSERYIQLQILQGLIDGLAALLVYWIAMQLFKRPRPALLAAGLYALYPPIAWESANPYTDIWAVDFTIAIVAIYLVVLKSGHRWRWLIVCGLCAGIGAYFRPNVLLIAPVLALATIAGTGWREALRRAIVVTLVASLLLVPWTIRNYNDFHAFIPTRTSLWENMLAGLVELPNGFGRGFSVESVEGELHRARPDLVYETPAWDSALKHYVIRAIEQHPLFYLELVVHRVALATIWSHETLWMHRGAGALFASKGGLPSLVVDHPLVLLEYALQPTVFLLAMLGLIFTWRRWRRQNVLLLALAVCVLVPYIAIHVEARYLLPATLAYFIWIGLGADLVIERVKQTLAASSWRARRTALRPARPPAWAGRRM